MEFRILGPVEVVHDGQPARLAGAKPRAVLAYLLIHAGEPASSEALITELWGDSPPASATNTLQTYISQLRRIVEPGRHSRKPPTVLRTIAGGYQLAVDPQSIDSVRFEQQLRAAQDAEPGPAAQLLRDALALWRGPALADVVGCVAAEQEAERLEQQRLLALELRIAADLALGRHAQVAIEAGQLANQHPLRETFTEQRMLALYRCGRQAEALGVYRGARAQLVDELGVEPGRRLRELESRILRQDPGLALPPVAAETRPPGVASVDRTRPGLRARWLIPAAAAIVVAVAVAAALATGPDRGESVRPEPGTIFNEFDLAVNPGIGYDLDIPPGKPPDWHATNNPRSPDYAFLDFYRTSVGPDSPGQISGVDLDNTNNFNVIHLVGPDDSAQTCRLLPQHGGGNVKLAHLTVGAKVCLRTWENRWAMLTITRMPPTPAAVLTVHAVVIND